MNSQKPDHPLAVRLFNLNIILRTRKTVRKKRRPVLKVRRQRAGMVRIKRLRVCPAPPRMKKSGVYT
jgi:hypothetical protein